jgi:hypothetical protein
MVRSPAAPSPLLFSELLFADSGADDGARVIGATDDDDDVGFAWSGRWRRRDLRVDRSTMAISRALTGSTLVLLRFGATMELGRSERTTMRPLWSNGVDGANTPDRKPR